MKNARMLIILVLGLMVWPVSNVEAVPMGTAITYQGRLIDANSAADGEYDFEFKLFDDPCTGTQQGGTINESDLDVIDGYFTVELDFGSVFNGDGMWLEIDVRPGDSNDANAFATLIPRQKVTTAPYAMYAVGSDWANLKNMPAGFADGIDNVGSGDITAVNAGAGLSGGGAAGSVTLIHADTSAQSGVNNFNGTVLQDLFLDGYGHVTSLGSYNLDSRYYTESEMASLYFTKTQLTTSGGNEVHWGSLSNVPAGFADGVDNTGSGDITAVYAGTGLSGGGSAGDVTVSVSTSWADGRYVNEGQANSVTSGMITNQTIDDADMGFMRWGEWWGRYNHIIFEAAGRVRIYLASDSDMIYIRNLGSSGSIIAGYAVHKDATTSTISRKSVAAGATISINVAWYADISINIYNFTPDYALFFKGVYVGSSSGAVIAGYYNYFDSSALPVSAGGGVAEAPAIRLEP